MNMMSKIRKIVAGSVFCFAAICASSKEVLAYNSVFFDASIDTRNWQLVVEVEYEDHDSDLRAEDTHLKESATYRNYASGAPWKTKFDPKDETKPYAPDAPSVFARWVKDSSAFGSTDEPSSKKLTVPAMKLVKEDGTGVASLRASDSKTKILINAIRETDRDSGNLSMIDGLNQILRRIETLKGGYDDEVDFKNVLKALGYLFEGENGRSVIIGVEDKGEEIKGDEDENTSNSEELEPDDEFYEGNGKNIIVTIVEGGPVVKTVKITQEGAPNDVLWKKSMLIKTDTGYKMSGGPKEDPGVGAVKITGPDGTVYENANKFKCAIIEPVDIEYITLSNLIAHAIIKFESGIVGDESGSDMNGLEKIVYGMLSGALGLLETGLGLVSFEDLVYNAASLSGSTDERGRYVLGMYPKVWENLIVIMYSFVGVISVSVLVFSVLKIFYKMTLDSMNVGKRMELKEEISGILQTVITMLLFVFMFRLVATINYILVKVIYNGVGGGSISLLGADSLGSNLIANVVLRAVMLCVKVHINVLYVIRSLNLALLLALSPAFVTAIAFGKKDLFAKYVHEIIGNIFLQTFHAFFFLFIFEAQSYINPTDSGGLEAAFTSTFTSVVLTFSVMPITKVFKTLCMPSVLMETGQGIAAQFSNKAKQYGMKGLKGVGNIAKQRAGYAAASVYENLVGDKISNTMSNTTDTLADFKKHEKGFEIMKNIEKETDNFTDQSKMMSVASNLTSEQKEAVNGAYEFMSNLSDEKMEEVNKGMIYHNKEGKKSVLRAQGIKAQGAALRSMNKQRKEMQETMNNLNNYKAMPDVLEKAKNVSNMQTDTRGVYDLEAGGISDNGSCIAQEFSDELGFKEMKLDSSYANPGNSDGGGFTRGTPISGAGNPLQGGFSMKGYSSAVDNFKMPSQAKIKTMPKEIQNAYGAMEYMQKARQDIRNYTKSMNSAKSDEDKQLYQGKIDAKIDEVNNTLRTKFNATQVGFVDRNIESSSQATLTISAVGNNRISEGPMPGGISIGGMS